MSRSLSFANKIVLTKTLLFLWPMVTSYGRLKICILGVLEPPGPSKSDSSLKHDSFWWGARLQTAKIRLFQFLGPGLWSQVSGLRSQVSSLRSQVSGLNSWVSGLRSRVSGLRSQVSGLRSQVSSIRSRVSGLSSHFWFCFPHPHYHWFSF